MAESPDIRNLVLQMLAETLENGEFSHIVINRTFSETGMDVRDRAFAERLYLGVLERLIYLDYCIDRVSNVSTRKMRPVILNILRCGTYQLLFMDSVPDHAAINESVSLVKKRGLSKLVPFVNAVLRNIQRSGREQAEEGMPVNVRLSAPKWMYTLVKDVYGTERAVSFFEGTLKTDGSLCIRLNTLKADRDEITASLKDGGCDVRSGDDSSGICYLKAHGPLTQLDAYKKGWFSVQDISSVKAALAGCRELKKSKVSSPLIVDVCAAPGGKSICAAQEFPDAEIISRDISLEKTALIDENIERLGIKNMRSEVFDAAVKDLTMQEKADMVIADLPCSGLGVIGKKPDIKYRIRQKDLAELAALQRQIIGSVWGYVKKGGILLYSTCTVNAEENGENVRWIIEKLPFELISEEQILEGEGDGFYIAVLKRR